ncbi:putative protein [Geobacter sp. OR-1]|uniref:GGDEF domain-containing protein n=1 Tax=Geobacter sp. OR-1 TaxID=1266765 RepID=UPI000543E188|nr:GGDEF domain-containing protein [Geobacter sp. OR-1]GAM09750.1 putative protein [Geobacter sp. OR-1]
MLKKCVIIECLYFLENQNSRAIISLGLIFTMAIGMLDNLTGETFSLALFYLIPIGLYVWYISLRTAIAMSVICTLIWASSNHDLQTASLISNTVTNLGFYCLFSIITHRSRVMYDHEKLLSRTDHLTGLLNNRSFYEIAQNYLCIMKRTNSPFSIAFIDLDNFKEINDQYGHDIGDTVLKDVADSIISTIRVTDKAARFGGDEFVIIFPDTSSDTIALIMGKITAAVSARMNAFNYNVSFSAGVVCCSEPAQSLDELIIQADKLMYEVKNSGKSSFKFMEL